MTPPVRLSFSAVHDGTNNWTESVALYNLTTSTEIATQTRTINDADNSFANNENRLRMYANNLYPLDGSVTIDSLTVIPEPSTTTALISLALFGFVLIKRRK